MNKVYQKPETKLHVLWLTVYMVAYLIGVQCTVELKIMIYCCTADEKTSTETR